jgi:tRNA 5-methylaminomethyl-2-thiouridine biosynthesis bifunctional protein
VSKRHVIFDADFGGGERFLAAWAERGEGQLHYLAVTPRLAPAESIASPQLRALWPLNLPGWHRVLLDGGRVTLDLMVGALADALPEMDARVDAFYLPQVGPDDNPMFSYTRLAKGLSRIAVQGATLWARAADAGASVPLPAQAARERIEALAAALRPAGFACEALAAPDAADTSDELRAVYASRKPQAPVPPEPERRAVVIGAGLAGSSAAHRLCARGWQVTLVERHADVAQEASGNVAGIFMPLLSRDDNLATRLTRAAYLFALREWKRLGGVGQAFEGAPCGVLQLARDAAHAQLQRDIVEQWQYPQEYVQWVDAQQASAMTGFTSQHGGWLFEQGGWARPASFCAALLAACGTQLTRRFSSQALTLHRIDGEWQVRGADGAVIAQAPTVILANGNGARQIEQSSQLPLYSLRGQVTHLKAGEQDVPDLSLVVCREAYVTPATHGIVCAGATYNTHDPDTQLRAASQQENLERLTEIMTGIDIAAVPAADSDGDGSNPLSVPSDARIVAEAGHCGSADDAQAGAHATALILPGLAQAPLAGRVGFRCAGPDRLPLAGALPDYGYDGRLERLRNVPRHPGLHCLLGYASRGLIWAPLMAEVLVSQLENTSLPLEATLAAALDPARFLLKERRRAPQLLHNTR